MKEYKADQYFEFTFNTQRFDTGAATDADALPTYRVYEENNDTVIASGDCAKRDDANTTGYYYCRAQITVAGGYEVGKTYEVRAAATVNGVAGATVIGRFTVLPDNAWDALHGGTDNLDTNAVEFGGQEVTAAAPVTVPASIGTSTYAGGAVASVTAAVTVGTNSDKTGYTLADNSITQNTLDATAGSEIGNAVWSVGGRTLTGFGTLVSDIVSAVWAAGARTLTAISDSSGVTTLLSRLSAARAGFLDWLNIGGLAASQADIQGITQAQRVRVSIAPQFERPDAGSTPYRIWIYAYDAQHQAEDLDGNPTVTAENNAGTDRSANLGAVTKLPATTGIYYVEYTVSSTDAVEGLVFKVTATEGAVSTQYPAAASVVDTTAVDFTAADRAKLEAVFNKLPSRGYLTGSAAATGEAQTDVQAGLTAQGYTGARAGYVDVLNGLVASVWAAVTDSPGVSTLLARLSAAWAAKLDDIRAKLPSRGYLAGSAAATGETQTDTAAALTGYDPPTEAEMVAAFEAIQGADGDTLKTLSDQIDGIAGASGSGANPVTVTLEDGTGAPVPGLLVCAWNSAITARLAYGHTNSSGQVVFNLDAGDIKVAVSTTVEWEAVAAVSYTVTNTGAQAVPDISLTAHSVTPPPTASQIVGVLNVYDGHGALDTSGVTFTYWEVKGPGTTGQSHASTVLTTASDGSGVLQVTLTKGARYFMRRGTGTEVEVDAPTSGDSFNLPEVLGTP